MIGMYFESKVTSGKIRMLVLLIGLILPAGTIFAQQQDTLLISLQDLEKRYAAGNLQLLGAQAHVGGARGDLDQVKLFSNPNISVGQNIYNQMTGKWFDASATGNTDIQLQQIFPLTSRREQQLKLSTANIGMAEGSQYDLGRQLRFQLRTDFFDCYFLQKSVSFYNRSIETLTKTIDAVEKMYDQRLLLLSEVLRLKTLLLSLESERQALLARIIDKESDFALLTGDTSLTKKYLLPDVTGLHLDDVSIDSLSLPVLVDNAIQNRPDLKIAEKTVEGDEANLELQKALAIPDLQLGGAWSRAGSYIPNYYALTLSMDLPIFNRNQGNIEAAQSAVEEHTYARELTRYTVEQDVNRAYIKAIQADSLYRKADRKMIDQFSQLVDGMVANYEHRNIGIIEFTDFFETYRTSMIQLNQLQANRLDAFEGLNFAVGSIIITP